MNSANAIHVVFGSNSAGVLREALRLAGRKEQVAGFPDCLGFGPIDPPDPAVRLDWMVQELGIRRLDWDWLPAKVDTFWERALAPGVRRVVWTSKWSVTEYSAFLEWVLRLDDAPYEVIDLTEVEVRFPMKAGGTRRGRALSIGYSGAEIIAKEVLWDRARAPDRVELDRYRQAWTMLKRENAPSRIAGPTGLTSAPISAFDEHLLSFITDEWQRAIYPIGHAMLGQHDQDYFQIGDFVLASRLVALGRAGMIEFRMPEVGEDFLPRIKFGLSSMPRDAEVRLASGSSRQT